MKGRRGDTGGKEELLTREGERGRGSREGVKVKGRGRESSR